MRRDSIDPTIEAAAKDKAEVELAEAELLGVDVTSYRDWKLTGGRPRCAATTSSGYPCRSFAGSVPVDLHTFIRRDRRILCRAHKRQHWGNGR